MKYFIIIFVVIVCSTVQKSYCSDIVPSQVYVQNSVLEEAVCNVKFNFKKNIVVKYNTNRSSGSQGFLIVNLERIYRTPSEWSVNFFQSDGFYLESERNHQSACRSNTSNGFITTLECKNNKFDFQKEYLSFFKTSKYANLSEFNIYKAFESFLDKERRFDIFRGRSYNFLEHYLPYELQYDGSRNINARYTVLLIHYNSSGSSLVNFDIEGDQYSPQLITFSITDIYYENGAPVCKIDKTPTSFVLEPK